MLVSLSLFPPPTPTWTDLGLIPDLRDERLELEPWPDRNKVMNKIRRIVLLFTENKWISSVAQFQFESM